MSKAKRFYKDVAIAKTEAGFEITLDGRPLKTPGKQTLRVKQSHIAQLVADEWAAQEQLIRPETMPVTRLVNVALELTPSNRDKLVEEARKYAGTDLLCYRAAEPVSLARRQAEKWDPVLDWARTLGADLKTTDNITAIDQAPEALDVISRFTQGLDDLNLTLFVHLTAVFGSAILAMAVLKNHISGSQGFDLSRLDNLYQIEQWGEDEEAAEIAASLGQEVEALCRILEI